MSLVKDLKTTFNDVAALYDEVRPGYPNQLIEDVVALAGIQPGGRILEIGCGPGRATLPFAKRGYAMLCLELGAELARLAREHCRSYPAVEIQTIAFEEWPLQKEAFDLVICAEAFHWIAPEVAWSKTAAALKPESALALFWIGHHTGTSPFFQWADELYREHAPQLAQARRKTSEELERETVAAIEASSFYGKVTVRRYPWRETYTADTYGKLLCTYAPVQNLTEEARQGLLKHIHALIQQHGGVVECDYTSRLYVAKVRR